MTIVQASSLLNINYSNAKKIVEAYRKEINKENIGAEVLPRGTPAKINNEIVERIERIVESNSCYTLENIKRILFEQTGTNISVSSVHNILTKLKITLKQGNRILERVNSEETKEKRQEYALKFTRSSPIDKSKCIFIDESGFNYHMRRNQARSPKGIRAKIVVPMIRGANKTLIVASNQERIIFHKLITIGTCNGERFKEFIIELIKILNQDDEMAGSWIIMDNARIHGTADVRNLIDESSYTLEFLSPYSCMLNPVEHIFSKIKLYVRSAFANSDSNGDIIEMINNAISTITAQDCMNYTLNMMRNISLAIEKVDF